MADVAVSAKVRSKINELSPLDRMLVLRWIARQLMPLEDARTYGSPVSHTDKNAWLYTCGRYRLVANADGSKIILLDLVPGIRKKTVPDRT